MRRPEDKVDTAGKIGRGARSGVAVAALLCATVAAGQRRAHPSAPVAHGEPATAAYFQGKIVHFTVETPAAGGRAEVLGPWELGARAGDRKPRDKRLNLYVVAPGQQYRSEAWAEFDHNLVINDLPVEGAAVEWDVFYAVVLDPKLRDDLRSERDLLVAAQERFVPGDLYDIEDAPGEGLLRGRLHVESLEDLAAYRNPDGSLPRLVLQQAGFAIRATASAEAAADPTVK